MRWPHFKALVLFLIHKVWALFAWSTLPFRRERAKEWSCRRRRHQNRGHDYSSYGYVLVWYGTPLQSQMVAPVKGHKLLKECFATCHYLSLCPKYITSNLSEKNRACTQSLSYKSWSEMSKKMGANIKRLKLPNFTSRLYRMNKTDE